MEESQQLTDEVVAIPQFPVTQDIEPEPEDENLVPSPVKKLIVYEDSELMKSLKNYNIEPDAKLQRKIDYYFMPYNHKYNLEKYMFFDESVDNRRKYPIVKGWVPREYTDLQKNSIENKNLLSDVLWTKLKDKIFETERPILKGLQRHVDLTLN